MSTDNLRFGQGFTISDTPDTNSIALIKALKTLVGIRPRSILPRNAPTMLIIPSPIPIKIDWTVNSPSNPKIHTLGNWINPYPTDYVPTYALADRPYER